MIWSYGLHGAVVLVIAAAHAVLGYRYVVPNVTEDPLIRQVFRSGVWGERVTRSLWTLGTVGVLGVGSISLLHPTTLEVLPVDALGISLFLFLLSMSLLGIYLRVLLARKMSEPEGWLTVLMWFTLTFAVLAAWHAAR